MRAPDVALITPFPPRGSRHGGWTGVASYGANLAGALGDAGARVSVIASAETGEPALWRDGTVEVRRVWRRGPAALPAAAAAAHATGAPAVHLQHELFLYGGAAAVPGVVPALARLRGRRTVVTMHHVVDPAAVNAAFAAAHGVRVPAPVARAGVAALQRTIRSLAGAVVVHEPSFAAVVPGAEVVPHGIEVHTAGDREAARADLGVEPGRLCVLCFGFLAPYKGLEAALGAARLAGDDVRLVIAGGEHPRLAGDGYAAALRASAPRNVRFTGYVPGADVARWFAAVVPGAEVVPHGIEVAQRSDRDAARAALGVESGRLCVLCFGFLSPYKGLEAALGAARLAGDGVELVIAGGEHPRLEATGDGYAERLRASAPPNARFTGFVPEADVARWFAAADVALLPYPRPFASSGPLALALAHDTPVLLSEALARTTGAPQELAVGADPQAIAARLRTLAADAGERDRLRAAAATLATGRTWPEIARRHIDLYGSPA